jgi:hypothetical protein
MHSGSSIFGTIAKIERCAFENAKKLNHATQTVAKCFGMVEYAESAELECHSRE